MKKSQIVLNQEIFKLILWESRSLITPFISKFFQRAGPLFILTKKCFIEES